MLNSASLPISKIQVQLAVIKRVRPELLIRLRERELTRRHPHHNRCKEVAYDKMLLFGASAAVAKAAWDLKKLRNLVIEFRDGVTFYTKPKSNDGPVIINIASHRDYQGDNPENPIDVASKK